MPYYRCPGCAFTVHSVAGRFTARICPRCSVRLARTDEIPLPERAPPEAISHRFPADPGAAPAAREALEMLIWEHDCQQLQTAALLTTELIANGVEHSGARSDAIVRLNATLTGDLLRVEVGDDGPGFVHEPRTADAPLDSHWGLHLVDHLADRWGVAQGQPTLVWFELDMAQAAAGAAADSTLRSGVAAS